MKIKDWFIIIGIISVFIMFFSPFINSLSENFNDISGSSILARAILGILVILIVYFIIKKTRNKNNMNL